MSQESIDAAAAAILFFIKICIGIVVVRIILYYCGFKDNVPILDSVAEHLIPIFVWIWKTTKAILVFFYRFVMKFF
jgi:hypothetical protein